MPLLALRCPGGGPLRAKGGPSLTTSKDMGPWVSNYKELVSTNNWNEPGREFFPEVPVGNAALLTPCF